MNLLSIILSAIYFYFPAATANLAANFGKYIPWKFPVDFGIKLRGRELVGKHKTFAGFFLGIFFGMLVAYLQMLIYKSGGFGYEIIDYTDTNWLLLGFTMSFGALSGDLIESAVKRRLSLKPHARLVPFDQIDHILGSLTLTSFFFKISWQIWIACLVIYFIVHEVSTRIGFLLKIKNVPH